MTTLSDPRSTVAIEWGLFNDEGQVEGDYYSQAEAARALADYDADDHMFVARVCVSCREGIEGDCDCEDDV